MSPRIFYTFLLVLILSLVRVDLLYHDVYWRDYIPNEIPYDAIEAAPGRYIGQVYYSGYIVAHIYSDTNTAVFQYSKKRVTKENIKILCSRKQHRLYWEEVDFRLPHDQQMKDAIKGGFGWDTPLFIGKTEHEGEWKIGIVYKIEHHKWAGLWVWNAAGYEINFKQFHMLKYNSTMDNNECNCECGSGLRRQNASTWL